MHGPLPLPARAEGDGPGVSLIRILPGAAIPAGATAERSE